jgi:hypothetical protein
MFFFSEDDNASRLNNEDTTTNIHFENNGDKFGHLLNCGYMLLPMNVWMQIKIHRVHIVKCLIALNLLIAMTIVTQYRLSEQHAQGQENWYYNGYTAPVLPDEPYNINTNWTCNQRSPVKVLIVVHSAVSYLHKRAAIRNTWANLSVLRSNDMYAYCVFSWNDY